MKRVIAVVALLVIWPALGSTAEPWQAEKLVLNATATRVDLGLAGRKGIEIFNNGPARIDCNVDSSTVTLTKNRPIAAGTPWSFALPPGIKVYCKAATADQLTGAATIVTEVR